MRVHEQRNLLLASTFKTEKALHHFDGYLRSNKFQGIGEDYIRIQDVKNWLDNIRRELVKATMEMDHFEREKLKDYFLHPLCPVELHDLSQTTCWMCDQLTLYWELLEEERVGGWTVIRL